MTRKKRTKRNRLRLVYLRRVDGVLQRYRTRDPGKIARAIPAREARKEIAARQKARRKPARKPQEPRKKQPRAKAPGPQAPLERAIERYEALKNSPRFREIVTFFQAEGYADREVSQADSPQLLALNPRLHPHGFSSGPVLFRSNWDPSFRGGLGRIRWGGFRPLEFFIDKLNRDLGIRDSRGRRHDFRAAYQIWKLQYGVFGRLRKPKITIMPDGSERKSWLEKLFDFRADNRNRNGRLF